MKSRRMLPIVVALIWLAPAGRCLPTDPELPQPDLLRSRIKSFCRALERHDSTASLLLTLYHAKQLATLAQWSADLECARDEKVSNCKGGPPQRLAGEDFKTLGSHLHDRGVEIDGAADVQVVYRVRDAGGESYSEESVHVWVHTSGNWFWYEIKGHEPY